MREIKFRAWDTIAKQMTPIQNKFVCFTGVVWENWREGLEGEDNLKSTKRLILMQFTGLLDKNGKEIYEGDIVLATNEYDLSTMSSSGVVAFINDRGYFGILLGQFYTPLHEFNRFEVIGNIYKNK